MAAEGCVCITVVVSPGPRETIETTWQLKAGATVADALQRCGESLFVQPDLLDRLVVGIWGKEVPPGYALQEGDRLELYRPLTVDPKVARRLRFTGQGSRKVAGLFARRRLGAKTGY